MHMKSRARTAWPLIVLGILGLFAPARAAAQAGAQAAPQTPPARVTLDQAIDMALKHNHSLQAARTMILQNQAQEITANLRPNPTLSRRYAVSAVLFTQATYERLISIKTRNSISDSVTFSSADKSASTACRRPRIRRR